MNEIDALMTYGWPIDTVLTLVDGKKVVAKQFTPLDMTTTRGDPAHWMLHGDRSMPETYSKSCYICRDPEYARMGLPLCYACPYCGGHIPADDSICDSCGRCDRMFYESTYLFLQLVETLLLIDHL